MRDQFTCTFDKRAPQLMHPMQCAAHLLLAHAIHSPGHRCAQPTIFSRIAYFMKLYKSTNDLQNEATNKIMSCNRWHWRCLGGRPSKGISQQVLRCIWYVHVIVHLLFIKMKWNETMCSTTQFACSHKLKINGYNCLNSINGRYLYCGTQPTNQPICWIKSFWFYWRRFGEIDYAIGCARYKL